jgi:hypothetical protein
MGSGRESVRRLGKRFFAAWKRFALFVGLVNTHLLLFLVYWLVFGPFSLALKLLGKDHLRLRPRQADSYWLPREPDEPTIERARHPF